MNAGKKVGNEKNSVMLVRAVTPVCSAEMDKPEVGTLQVESQRRLVERARAALLAAYADYSHYRVGAAVLWFSGCVTQGCNVENVSYGLTMCAERVALFTGVAQGERVPRALAVAVEAPEVAFPCGACLQVMAEWVRELPIYLTGAQGDVHVTDLAQLLPRAFGVNVNE